jgi:hypothetical protein
MGNRFETLNPEDGCLLGCCAMYSVGGYRLLPPLLGLFSTSALLKRR